MGFLVCRKRAGMTQMELAKALGVSDAAVCQWEKGVTMPTVAKLKRIAQVLSCSVEELLKEE